MHCHSLSCWHAQKSGQKLLEFLSLKSTKKRLSASCFFLNQKKNYEQNPYPILSFKVLFNSDEKLFSPHFRKGKLEEPMERSCLQKVTKRPIPAVRAPTCRRLPSKVLSTQKHWPPIMQQIFKANYACKMNLADLAVKRAMRIPRVTLPLLKSSYLVLIWPHLLSLTDRTSDHLKGKTGMMYFFNLLLCLYLNIKIIFCWQ